MWPLDRIIRRNVASSRQVANPARFERATPEVEALCSIQLSYGSVVREARLELTVWPGLKRLRLPIPPLSL